MKKFWRCLGWLSVIGFLIFFVTGCKRSAAKQTSTKINVVATTNFYGNIAKAILGNQGKVTAIINSPNVDPHEFTPTTATAKTIAHADFVIENGIGYDTWVERLQGEKYLNVGKIVNAKNGANEHLWYDPANIEKLVDVLVDQFSHQRPQQKAYFEQNANKYHKKLAGLQQQMNQIKQTKQQTKIAVSEPVFNYALEQMGFKICDEHFAHAIEEGSDPSYTDIRNLQNAIKHHQIAFFVLNRQDESKLVDHMVDLCKQENIPILRVTETMPQGANYIDWFSGELKQLAQIVNNQSSQGDSK